MFKLTDLIFLTAGLVTTLAAQAQVAQWSEKRLAAPELLGDALIVDVDSLEQSTEAKAQNYLESAPLVQALDTGTATSGFVIDHTNRNGVAAGYHEYFLASEGYASVHGYTGDVANCVPGTVSDDFQDMTLRRVNYYRAQAGLPADIFFTAAKNLKAQKGATIMAHLNTATHYPAIDYPNNACVLADQASGGGGIEAAGKSNLSRGSFGPRSVDGQMTDDGSNNTLVGHRRWILYSRAQEMGNGAVPANGSYPYTLPDHPATDCLWVIGDFKATPTAQAVPWPNEGHIPWDLAPNDGQTYPRWSYSYPGANFSAASVTMTQGASNISLTQEPVSSGVGDNTLVWRPSGIPNSAPLSDTTYTISITGITGAPFSTATYDVILIDPYTLNNPPDVSGSTSPAADAANNYNFSTVDQAEAYEARISEIQSGTWLEGAEDSPSPSINDFTDDSYMLISSAYHASGLKAFHLTTPDFGEDSFTINRVIYPQSDSEILFKYRRFFMHPDTKLYVELSNDEGASYSTIYTLSGQNTGNSSQWDNDFIDQNVPIPTVYQNKSIRLRFRISAEGSTFIGSENTNGIYIDDISATNCLELTAASTIALAGDAVNFNFIPNASDQLYLLEVRPQLGGHWFGYGDALAVTSVDSTPPAEVEVSGNGLDIADGDSSPSTIDGTDFGGVNLTNGSVSRTFRVSNAGGSTLSLGAASSSSVDFTVSGLSSSINAGNYDDFTVVFDPSSSGTKTAIISFTTNDGDENPFSFAVSGVGTEPVVNNWYDGASEIDNGWRYFDWFKGFKPETGKWIYHGRHGWLYVVADDTSGMFLWDVALGRWMFTSEIAYPWMYAYGPHAGWVFFFEGGQPGSRYFKRGDTGAVVSEQNLAND